MNSTEKKHIAILGSTGSIGRQSLEVISEHTDLFEVDVLTTNNRTDLLIQQAKKFKPNVVVVGNEDKYKEVFDALDPLDIKVYAGKRALSAVVEMTSIDMVLVALVGYIALQPTLNAIEFGKSIALANKEILVVAGELVTTLAKKKGVILCPIDSEHSAIFQCLIGELHNSIEKIILTASGGPFRGKSKDFLKKITKKEALKHPNWSMGDKITIDSASLMNKGLEVIEAKWLFGLEKKQIEVIVHPQSIIHSIVQFQDGSMKAQMGLPDMRTPIQYALGYPYRLPSKFPRFNFLNYFSLTFEQPNIELFRNLSLAFNAMDKGGSMPCVLNAANEVVVDAFLHDKVKFLEMPDIIETCMSKVPFILSPNYDNLVEVDKESRIITKELINI